MKSLSTIVAAGLAALTFSVTGSAFAQTAPVSDAAFQELGGKPGIKKIVAEFIPIILADPRIKDAFAEVDMERLGVLLEEQFCELTGGPCKYSGKDMKTIHQDTKSTNAQFNALAEDLQIAMEKVGIPSRAQNKLVAKLAPMQRDIVTR